MYAHEGAGKRRGCFHEHRAHGGQERASLELELEMVLKSLLGGEVMSLVTEMSLQPHRWLFKHGNNKSHHTRHATQPWPHTSTVRLSVILIRHADEYIGNGITPANRKEILWQVGVRWTDCADVYVNYKRTGNEAVQLGKKNWYPLALLPYSQVADNGICSMKCGRDKKSFYEQRE